MAHHSSGELPDEFKRLFQREETGPLGATGRFPFGKLTANDEGELRIAIGQQNGKVVVDFGKPTAWIGFTADQADDIADLLHKHAAELRGQR